MMSPAAPDFGAASDGDGDRNLIIGRGHFVTPSDSLAMLAANAHLRPATPRASPASRARCRPAPPPTASPPSSASSYETPTGWKFFGNLLDAGLATLCGEESFGTGSNHVREKDGLWAVLLWLNILAKRRIAVADLARDHWATYGRNYYTRHDYDEIDHAAANGLMNALRGELATLPGKSFGALRSRRPTTSPITIRSTARTPRRQGMRMMFDGGSRIVYRLSGTGTVGATLRVYIERYEPPAGDLGQETQTALADLIALSRSIAEIEARTGRKAPSVVT